jgi:fatty-acyl-CoA synthase
VLRYGSLDGPPMPAPARVGPDVPAYLQFSSGTTTEPRAVAVTGAALAAHCVAISEALAFDGATDRGVSWRPLHHDMGLVGFVLGRPV